MAAELYGAPIDDAWRRMGHRAQAVGVESSLRTDGADAGTRRIRMINGELDIEILPDRGLDIGQVRIAGIPLAWITPAGFPEFDPDGGGWLRAFGGGLLTTCGLLSYGAPSIDDGVAHQLHGRHSSLKAQVTRAEVTDDELVVEGLTREVAVFGAHLELRRRITSPLGSRSLRVRDIVVNRGVEAVQPMVLYHLNLGWPLVDEGTQLVSPATKVVPRDAEAERGLATWSRFPAASSRYPEQVFRHELPAAERVAVVVQNSQGLSLAVRFDTAQLGALFQWRVAQPHGHTVLGIEPATAPTILGRADARARGLLRSLEPGEQLELGVEIEAKRTH